MNRNSLVKAYFIKPSSETRVENDYYPTAPIATYCLLKNYEVPHNILEPAAGRGWISSVLEENGHTVVSRDLFAYPDPFVHIETGIDFLTSKKIDFIDGVVTNPPYKNRLADKFLTKSLEDYDFTAFFCRLTFLEGDRRGKLFRENPPTQTMILSRRINCDEKYFDDPKTQIGGMVPYAWYIWDKRAATNSHISWVDPMQYVEELRKPTALEKFLV